MSTCLVVDKGVKPGESKVKSQFLLIVVIYVSDLPMSYVDLFVLFQFLSQSALHSRESHNEGLLTT